MVNKKDWKYILVIILCLLLGFFLRVRIAEAGILDWFRAKEVEVIVEAPKTIESEIDRLAIKYEIASSTIRAVSKCESQMYGEAINRNRLPDGTIWSSDFGPLQINDYYHEAVMTNLGLDIHNQYDSLEYGVMMMKEQGLKPWSASSRCWSKII